MNLQGPKDKPSLQRGIGSGKGHYPELTAQGRIKQTRGLELDYAEHCPSAKRPMSLRVEDGERQAFIIWLDF